MRAPKLISYSQYAVRLSATRSGECALAEGASMQTISKLFPCPRTVGKSIREPRSYNTLIAGAKCNVREKRHRPRRGCFLLAFASVQPVSAERAPAAYVSQGPEHWSSHAQTTIAGSPTILKFTVANLLYPAGEARTRSL